MSSAAILPSRNEPSTISAVTTTAVTTAVGETRAVIVHADSSDTPDTAEHFAATSTRATKVPLTGLVRGKGAQILAAARLPEFATAEAVLIADTDTENPDPAVYRTLLDRVRSGASLAIADYPRHWDEANLTNHLARPLISATTGHDVPQPLAGDLALSGGGPGRGPPRRRGPARGVVGVRGRVWHRRVRAAEGHRMRPGGLRRAGGAKAARRILPAPSAIYDQAVPVLLDLTGAGSPQPVARSLVPARYRVADRAVEPARLQATLNSLGPHPGGYR